MLVFLVVCYFSTANAGYLAPNYQANSIGQSHGDTAYVQAYYQPHGVVPTYQPQVKSEHVPVIKNGVPVDTPEVQQARAEHFALYAKAAAAAEAAKAAAAQKQQAGHYNSGNYHQPTRVYYTPQTNQHAPAAFGDSYVYQSGGHLSNSGAYAHPEGPVDSADVQQAKAAHFVVSNDHHRYRRGAVDYDLVQEVYPQHVPVITKDGVPLETPEVQVAKAQHLQAHANARIGHQKWDEGVGSYGANSGIWSNYGSHESNKVQYSIDHSVGGWQSYTGPQHYPQIDKDGVPVETPEVQLAKQQHYLAHSQAKHGLYGQGQTGSYYGSSLSHGNLTPEGVPEETPEVKIAKARHFAAHAEEQAKHAKYSGPIEYSYETNSHY